jgi:hypothetical protein
MMSKVKSFMRPSLSSFSKNESRCFVSLKKILAPISKTFVAE